MTLAIETIGLTKRYGRVNALSDVGLSVPTGCVYGFLGPNGAGKTTTVRALLGLISIDAGSVRLLGYDVYSSRLQALKSVGAFIERPSLYDHLSGEANLKLTSRMLQLPRSEVSKALEIVGLSRSGKKRVSSYSLGMRQRLAIARAILGTPKLLLLDEPTNGLDPDGIIVMRNLIRELPDRIGGTVFVSSHLLAEIEQVATVVGFMKQGRLLLQDQLANVLNKGDVLKLKVDDSKRGLRVLLSAGISVSSATGDTIGLNIARDASYSELAVRINRLMVDAGVGVYVIQLESRTLEQVYHDVVGTVGEVE